MNTTSKISFLKQKFLESAFVKDAATGYIVVKAFNILMDLDVLEFASRCWAEHYHHDTHIDAVVGLPDAGSRLTPLVGEMLRVKFILPSKRSAVVPGAWEDVVSFSNTSFTMGQGTIVSHIGFVKPGMRVLLIDDVVAHGSTAIAAIKALQERGAEVVGLAVLFDKSWQGGLAKITQETGVSVFSLISVKKIGKKGEVVLA